MADWWRGLLGSAATGASLSGLRDIDVTLNVQAVALTAWMAQLREALERLRVLTAGSAGSYKASTTVNPLRDVDVVVEMVGAGGTGSSLLTTAAGHWPNKPRPDDLSLLGPISLWYATGEAIGGRLLIDAAGAELGAPPNLGSSIRPDRARVASTAAEGPASPDFQAFKDLCRWLRLSDEEVAHVVGVRRTTPYAWERTGTRPRPETARRLYQVHAAVAALVQRYGEREAMLFLLTGESSPVALLMDGDAHAAMRSIEDKVFDRPNRPRVEAWTPEPDDHNLGALPAADDTVRLNPHRRRRRARPRD